MRESCHRCGSPLAENARFCLQCGANLEALPPPDRNGPEQAAEETSFKGRPPENQSMLQQPQRVESPALSAGEYILALFLLCIPFLGQVLGLVWGFSDWENLNRRNLARAVLALQGAVTVLVGIVTILGSLF